MSTPIKVGVVGATGGTGGSIVQGLLDSTTNFEITSLTRPTSVDKPSSLALKQKGVKIVAVDLTGPQDLIVKAVDGLDVVISCVYFTAIGDQYALIDACKTAGVKRFLPCNWQPVMPPTGVMIMREMKEEVINYLKKEYMPFTVVDVGWWYSITNFKVPSGKTDYAMSVRVKRMADFRMPGDGNVPIAHVDIRSIGTHVARIIADERTLNKYVFVYDEVLTANQIWDLLDEVSGEKCVREYVPAKDIRDTIEWSLPAYRKDPTDLKAVFALFIAQYRDSWGIRGDNTPERAKFLGYLDSFDLYPDLKPFPLRKYFEEVVSGKAVIGSGEDNYSD